MAKSATSIPLFLGEFRHAIDEKKRVTMPAKWRPLCTDGVIIFKNPTQPCLNVMSPADFDAVCERSRANLAPGKSPNTLRRLTSGAQQIMPDGQGRLLLVEDHCKQAGLRDEVYLIGVQKYIEIWSCASWETFKKENDDAESATLLGL